ncbi:hypothetical protein D3C86_756260 [compost metagenome]
MAQQAADAFDDGQPQPGAAFLFHAIIQPPEFLENLALQALRNARPLVVHLDTQLVALPAAADQHAPARGIAQRVGQKILQDAAQQRLVADHHRAGVHPAQLQAAAVGGDAELARQRFQQRRQREGMHVGLQRA